MSKSLLRLATVALLFAAVPAAQAAEAAAAPAAGRQDTETSMGLAQARLAFALIEKLGTRGDVTVSPASLGAAFGIVTLAADPAMKAAIAKAMGFGANPIEKSLDALERMSGRLGGAEGMFQSASRLVFAPASAPNALVRDGMKSRGIDYIIADLSDPKAAADIDAWVKEITHGAIPEILGGPVEKSSFVALNALHFKGRWKEPFDPQLTLPAPFQSIDRKPGTIAMMRLGSAERAFRKEGNFIGINLPFSDPRFQLTVVTTTDKPAVVRDFAKVVDWLAGTGFADRRGDLALPRFAASSREDLVPALDTLGLDKARRSPTALAGLAPGAMLTQIVQRTMIDVNEEGAEAAAATAVMAGRSLELDDGLHMVVDKPFIFALRDAATGLVLVAGYVGHPPKGKAG